MSGKDVKIEELKEFIKNAPLSKEEKTLVDFMEEQTGIGPLTARGFVLYSELEVALDLDEWRKFVGLNSEVVGNDE